MSDVSKVVLARLGRMSCPLSRTDTEAQKVRQVLQACFYDLKAEAERAEQTSDWLLNFVDTAETLFSGDLEQAYEMLFWAAQNFRPTKTC